MLRKKIPLYISHTLLEKAISRTHFKWAKAYIKQVEIAKKLFKVNIFKFEVQAPKNPKHAIKLDSMDIDGLWMNTIEKGRESIYNFIKCILLKMMIQYQMDTSVYSIT